ncbi:hypothetical protein [Glaciecola sp. 1036]|uniref:hypothetical protein n=1 Tax=Alteromonadaceae TaxID=72275 RepID=UPI003D046778
MDLVELGEASDSEYDREHTCVENEFPKFDRIIHCVKANDEPLNIWQIHGIHYAVEEEVKLGEADYVGQVTYHSVISINYCPFCGANLVNDA